MAYTVLATSPSRSIGVVEASIINASLMLDRVLLSTAFDEETITAALLGGLAASLPWAAAVIGTSQPHATDIAWGHYKKAATADVTAVTEAEYGADFALAVRVADDWVRVAIFQAKRPDAGAGRRIKILTSSINEFERFWQFDRLVSKALQVMHRRHEYRDAGIGDLDWVHYVGYTDSGPACVPLSAMQSFYEDSAASKLDGPTSVVIPAGSVSLMTLLRSGVVTPPGVDYEGWLALSIETANTALPHLRSLLPVYSVDERRGGGGQDLDARCIRDCGNRPSPAPPHFGAVQQPHRRHLDAKASAASVVTSSARRQTDSPHKGNSPQPPAIWPRGEGHGVATQRPKGRAFNATVRGSRARLGGCSRPQMPGPHAGAHGLPWLRCFDARYAGPRSAVREYRATDGPLFGWLRTH